MKKIIQERGQQLAYPAVLTPDEGAIAVSFPDVPEALTQGADESEALLRAVDALETALQFYVEAGEPLPRPSAAKRGQRLVRPPALSAMKLAVYAAMQEQKVRKTDLARRLGWHLMQIDRLLDLNHNSRVEHVESALSALGQQLTIVVRGQAA